MAQITRVDTYLFDWGDTLMVDFPDMRGKMCDWEVLKVCEGAKEVLEHISKNAKIYIATGAADSNEKEIQRAFERVGLSVYISGYFCKANLGVDKGSINFFKTILNKLNKNPNEVIMVGDSFEKDIKPALECGIKAIWLQKTNTQNTTVSTIKNLRELLSF